MPRPFVVASRSNQYRVHYVHTSADSAASNISSDASAEIALIMLIKLVCLLIGPVKVPILVCVLVDYPGLSIHRDAFGRVKSSMILSIGSIYNNMLLPSALRSVSHIVLENNFRFTVVSRVYIASDIG